MICPRCSVAQISEETNQCVLCGFSPAGSTVMVDRAPTTEELQEAVEKPLAGRFEIMELIGRGRASFVYHAREVETGRVVAVKVLPVRGPVDPDLVRRFEREVGRAMSLRHSHILPVYSCGASGMLLWYAMEYVKSRSLAELLRDAGPMDLEQCLRMVDQVGSALDYAHRRALIHGNIKPSNILIDEDGWVRVTGFSVHRAFGRAVLGLGVPSVRTPEYMAPEQFYSRGESASADQYALAVIIYECLGGTLPFVGDGYEEVARMHQEDVPVRLTELRDDVPLLFADAVEQALRKRPTERFANVLDFVTVLRGGPPQGAEVLVPQEGLRGAPQVLTIDEPRRRMPLVAVAIGAAALIALTTVIVLLQSGGSGEALEEGGFTGGPPPVVATTPAQTPVVPSSQVAPETRSGTPAQLPPPSRSTPPAQAAATPAPPPGTTGPPPVRSQPSAPRARAVESGKLFVNARPWGALYLDGELLGNTPKVNVPVAPGAHVIRVERDGYEPYQQAIQVRPGEEVRLTDITLRLRQP